ncbi:MAG: hypothetical protein OXC60_04890 [Litoreibacter sp.]|nr:hypothetical protein [Litoreibacter sp.]MCY4333994.1 hypothetical protein [Litoreibacter sp.]
MKRLSSVFSVSALSVLVACNGSTNPLEADLFDNIRNINDGTYDRQIAANEAEAARIARSNSARQSSINSLNAQKNANSSTIARLRGEIASARSELSSVRAGLGGDQAKLARANQLDQQLRAVDADARAGLNPSLVRKELTRIRSSIRALSS